MAHSRTWLVCLVQMARSSRERGPVWGGQCYEWSTERGTPMGFGRKWLIVVAIEAEEEAMVRRLSQCSTASLHRRLGVRLTEAKLGERTILVVRSSVRVGWAGTETSI